jgi:hypothetical protein
MRLIPLLLLLLSGAAFAQGVPVPPRPPMPPAYSPTTAVPVAPGYGVPPSSPAPRGTDRRVLPPTREPGIWASDRPLGPDGYPLPVILGYELPIPPDAVTPIEREAPSMCARMMTDAAKAIHPDRLKAIRPDALKCLAARLYDVCASHTHQEMLRAEREFRLVDHAMAQAFKKTAVTARAHLASTCAGVPVTRDTEEALAAAVAAFMRATRGEL